MSQERKKKQSRNREQELGTIPEGQDSTNTPKKQRRRR
jgi:hypothetical protein